MNLNSPLFLCLILASMTFVLCQVEEEEEIQVNPKIFEDQVQVNLNDEVEAPNPENAAVIEDDLEEDEISSSLLTLEGKYSSNNQLPLDLFILLNYHSYRHLFVIISSPEETTSLMCMDQTVHIQNDESGSYYNK
jgi:hypothetical protein